MNLHLGCGKRNIPGFINVDIADFPHVHHKRDVRNLAVFESNSVDLIYASHLLEYFDREEVKVVLKEWKRVLKPGATLRLAVPDFMKLILVYQGTGDIKYILGPLYGKLNGMYHKTVYDFKSLKTLLEKMGFKNVRLYDWRQTIHKDYDDCSQAYFPHMDKENGLLVSLNVEATK